MKTHRIGFLCALCVTIMVFACSDEEGPTDNRAGIRFIQDDVISVRWLSATLNDGESVWNFDFENFSPNATDSTLFRGPEVQTRADGTLRLSFRLTREDEFVFSSGSLGAPLSPNWRWTFDIVYSVGEPPITGDDYVRSSAFEVFDPAYEDGGIYIIWRGRGP